MRRLIAIAVLVATGSMAQGQASNTEAASAEILRPKAASPAASPTSRPIFSLPGDSVPPATAQSLVLAISRTSIWPMRPPLPITPIR